MSTTNLSMYSGLANLDFKFETPNLFKPVPLLLATLFPPPVLKLPNMPLLPGALGKQLILETLKLSYSKNNGNSTLKQAGVAALSLGADKLSDSIFDKDTAVGRTLGTVFSTSTDTIADNIIKGLTLTLGLETNVGASLGGMAAGYAGNLVGQGITSLGGNSMLSRGIGQGVATGIGTIGGQAATNLMNGQKAFSGISDSIKAIKDLNSASKNLKTTIDAVNTGKLGKDALVEAKNTYDVAKGLSSAAKLNLGGLGASIVGAGLQAAFGPSKEYGGKYGNITQGMDMAYDLTSGAVAFVPGVGTAISGVMALNKGLSNIFGSTSGMTVLDAILGSAWMPAPVKWVNVWGSSTTGDFNNQSWMNSEKANSFMGDAFGNLLSRFDRAREESGKTYGTFSQGAKRRALENIDFANTAWNKILAMSDQNDIQNIRSQYMSSVNNQRYALMLRGGFNPLAIGKQGMKIFNNATNHNMGMRLLSAAALIDNKQMILCNAHD